MNYNHEITIRVAAAHGERSQGISVKLLVEALQLCDDWLGAGGEIQAIILKAHILKDLAYESKTINDRSRLWKEALNLLNQKSRQVYDYRIAEAYALIAVDYFQDELCRLKFLERLQFLRMANKTLDTYIDNAEDAAVESQLLSRKSCIIRHLSMAEVSHKLKRNMLGKCVRCAEKALKQSRNAAALLELAQANWAMANYESKDCDYVYKLNLAESYLKDSLLAGVEIAQLTLARFYRLNFRPLEACEAFPKSIIAINNVRRLLRDSYVYAEAAVTLWFSDYPDTLIETHLRESMTMLETAIASGYRNARVITNLAFIRAICEGPQAGRTALNEIVIGSDKICWEETIKLVREDRESDLPSSGLALGIDQSNVWSKLGTFSYHFLGDDDLTESFYREAIRLNKTNAIALTNLARFLLEKNGEKSLDEVRRLLQLSQNFSDRRFTWWRGVQCKLEELEGKKAPYVERLRIVRQKPFSEQPPKASNFKTLRKQFRALETSADHQKRGYQLEVLIFRLAEFTFGTATGSYRISRVEGGFSQIDAYFQHRAEKYRVECKWTDKPSDPTHIADFVDKLDVAGISGLFISMGGFTTAAIGRAKEKRGQVPIILVDGAEIRALFNRMINFDDLMSRKRLYFDQQSEPYHNVVPNLVGSVSF